MKIGPGGVCHIRRVLSVGMRGSGVEGLRLLKLLLLNGTLLACKRCLFVEGRPNVCFTGACESASDPRADAHTMNRAVPGGGGREGVRQILPTDLRKAWYSCGFSHDARSARWERRKRAHSSSCVGTMHIHFHASCTPAYDPIEARCGGSPAARR